MGDLRGLIEAVEGGAFLMDVLPRCESAAYEAFSGSLDQAKVFHNAMLPGWTFRLTAGGAASPYVHIFKMRHSPNDPEKVANSAGYTGLDPARAWLLAILRALEAEGRG